MPETLSQLDELASKPPVKVVKLPRAPGEREARWAHLLCGEPVLPAPHFVGRAADGSKIKLTLYETVRERSGWKRGASGKMKSKRKVQARFAISLDIEVKTQKHGALALVA